MKQTLLRIFLISLCSTFAHAETLNEKTPEKINAVCMNEDVSLRYHAQWQVDEGTQQKILTTYGVRRIIFDEAGHPIPQGLSPNQIKRWERLYKLCMSDGCYYCDADEGSCELGTCGLHNTDCKPHLGPDGQPICGRECADYAFKSILICNDLS